MTQGRTTDTTPLASRRVFGALLAIGAGSTLTGGIAAGVAASVTELAPTDPDAELITLCEQFCQIERRHYAEAIALWRVGDDRPADAVLDRMASEHEPLVDRIVNLPPSTLQGAIALATALETWSHGDFARHDTTDELLARTLIRGLVGSAQV